MASEHNTSDPLEERVDAWLVAAADDPECRAATRRLALDIEFDFDGFSRNLQLSASDAVNAHRASIRLAAPEDVWEQVLSAVPPPGRHSFTALQRQCERFRVEADAREVARALHALERIFELAHGDVMTPAADSDAPGLDRISGSYAVVRTGHATARIYYEQAGEGVPLVMLHTAGADSRQYLDLVAGTDIADNWSCYNFDMPRHGRSRPPEGWEWDEYRLTLSDYVEWCLSFIDQVVGEPAVVMGCSMGASISIALAASGSPLVRSVIALEAPDKSPGRLNPYLSHPCVDSSDYDSAYVRGLMGPGSPVDQKRFAGWIYAQGGPGVYPGDLWFYSEEYDGLALAPRIDTARCPVYLLTGAYDYSAPPAATQRLCDAIPGARFEVMPDLGHFPMTEHPKRFYDYLRPVLAELREQLAVGADE